MSNTLIDQITSTQIPPEIKPRIVDEAELLTPVEPMLAPPVIVPDPATVAEPVAPVPESTIDPATPTPETPPVTTEPVKRGRGRPVGSRNKVVPSFEDVSAIAVVDYKAMSEVLFDMSTGVLANTFGPEWHAKTPEERTNVSACLAAYLKSKQVQDIPPGLMLTIIVVAYAAPRLQAPSTQEKIKPALAWTWAKVKAFFRRKQPQLTVLPPNKTTPDV